MESEAKLRIQDEIRIGRLYLVWSHILDLENDNNPHNERKNQISEWKAYAVLNTRESSTIVAKANCLIQKGMRKLDSLHVSCAVFSECEYFITTDDKVLNKDGFVDELRIVDPFVFIKEVGL